MPKTQNHLLGITLGFLYCLTSAVSLIMVNHYEQSFSPTKLLFYSFFITALIFIGLMIPKFKSTIHASKKYIMTIVLLNITTAAAWITTFYSLKYINPAIVIGIIFGTIPIANLIISALTRGESNITKKDTLFAIIIFLIITALISRYLIHVSHTINHTTDTLIYLSLAFCMIAGFGTASCIVYMKKLSIIHFSTTQIMSVRFLLITILSAGLMWISHISFSLSIDELIKIIFVVLLTTVLPLFLFQKSVEYTTATNLSFIIPLQPVITYAIQWIQGTFHLSFPLFFLTILLSITIIVSAAFKAKELLKKN